MESWESGELDENELNDALHMEKEVDLEAIRADPEISLHALTGSLNLKTMRVVGIVGGQKVVILIDSGSTHNFLDHFIVKRVN